eukprot:1161188-Pelagomonas_calceolata.AAC.6
MASYNMSTGSQPAPINPLSWIAGANLDRKQQQGLRSSPTAADADAEVCAPHPTLLTPLTLEHPYGVKSLSCQSKSESAGQAPPLKAI